MHVYQHLKPNKMKIWVVILHSKIYLRIYICTYETY